MSLNHTDLLAFIYRPIFVLNFNPTVHGVGEINLPIIIIIIILVLSVKFEFSSPTFFQC